MQNRDMKNRRPGHSSGRRAARFGIAAVGAGLVVLISAVAAITGAYYFVAPALPKAETIRDIPLQIPLRIYSRDGYLIDEIGERRRIPVTFDEVPEHVVNAFVAAEDQRFWEHPGIDYRGVVRAFSQLAMTGDIQSGGSTLTQQLARDYFLTREQSFVRKLNEAFLAWKIEQQFSKQQIMAFFLNKMFFGQRAYGVAAASQVFFNKELEDLTLAEAATLAGVLPAPSRLNPVSGPEGALSRRGYVLGRMRHLDYISEAEYAAAMAEPLESRLYGAAIELNAPYVGEMVRREMLKRYGDDVYNAGYQVVTSLDSRLQRAANYALRNGLLQFTMRRGYRGPLAAIQLPEDFADLEPAQWPDDVREQFDRYAPGGTSVALVTATAEDNSATIVFADGSTDRIPWRGMSWAKPFIDRETTGPDPERVTDVVSPGHVVFVMPAEDDFWALAQAPEAQGAVVSMDPRDGAITALAGGFDYTVTKFNRATQAFRQPGSAFKPFIYSAALEHGNTPATVVDDSPVVVRSSELERDWRPLNYTGRFYGPTRLREALTKSMNLVSVRLLLRHTGVGNAIRHIRKFGFNDAALPRNGSLALGGGNATPLDVAQGYAILANGGYAIRPYVIDRIYGPEGEALHRAAPDIVCAACEIDDDDLVRPDAIDDEEPMPLGAMAEVAMTYQPDAGAAPELFTDVPAAERVISAQNAFLIQDMMRDVVRRGTGARAGRELGRSDLSGKTGTSNDRRDAWFGGFNSDMATVVWVGYDDDQPLGPREEGSRTALPVWIDFAKIAYQGVPIRQMPQPEGIVSVRINPVTGCPARAGEAGAMFEYFREGQVPECDDAVDPGAIFDAEDDDSEEPVDESLF